jgi:hypothetical protein
VHSLILALGIGLATFIQASDRQTLSGFENFEFGMNVEKIQKLTPMQVDRPLNGGLIFATSAPKSVDGRDYKLEFFVKDNFLTSVFLNRDLPDTAVASSSFRGRLLSFEGNMESQTHNLR